MTDQMLRALRHHTQADEEPSLDVKIQILEHKDRVTATMLANMAELIGELTERLESLEQWREGANSVTTCHEHESTEKDIKAGDKIKIVLR